MKGQTYFNRQITKLFDNLQEQVDTLAGEIADIKEEIEFEKFDKEFDKILEERIDQIDIDQETILKCLRYCRHRLSQHEATGLHKADVKLKDIKRLIKEME